jgi:hypothetical protein
MMTQKTGALIFDETADRYDIRFDLNDYYGGLHCGDCMEVFVRGKWKPTRMEYGDNWYLVGIRAGADLIGRRENGRSFFMPAPLPGGGHTTIEHERRNPIAGGNQRKDHSPLHQDREADRAAAPKGYESPACTDEKAA